MHNKRYGLAMSLNGWVEGHVGRDLSLKGRAKNHRIVHWHIPINNLLIQINSEESVNCTCSIKVSVESLGVIL
jgi:hypothetical protein